MARSDAQRAADRRYAQTHRKEFCTWSTKFRTEEAKEIDEVIKSSGMSKTEFIRWAVEELKEKS